MQNDDISFNDIAKEIITTKKFKSLDKEAHHGLTRYIHIIRVSKFTYKITKKLKLDYISATRAALLHDYYNFSDFKYKNVLKMGYNHPLVAYQNAIKEFDLNDIEKNAITSHMFPLGKVLPKYKESIIISLTDKIVAIYEMSKYKFKNAITLYLIFISNMILFGQK